MTATVTFPVVSVVVAGQAEGFAVCADEPISFWGGYEPHTGEIIDRRHPLSGRVVAGCVLVIPSGRGSCSASGVFLESVRNETAPAAVIVSRVDPIIGLGSILGEELYGRPVPVVVLSERDRAQIGNGDHVQITNDGRVIVTRSPAVAITS
jgi:predicted aconitase with swiveling domain